MQRVVGMAASSVKPLESALCGSVSQRRCIRPHGLGRQPRPFSTPIWKLRQPSRPTWLSTVDRTVVPETTQDVCSAYGTAQPQEYSVVAQDESIKVHYHPPWFIHISQAVEHHSSSRSTETDWSCHSLQWKRHVLFCAVALGLASVHRVTLAILAVPFQVFPACLHYKIT